MKPSSIRNVLTMLIQERRPAFLWGAPGVGKSDLVRQVAKSLDLELRDVRLSMLDPVDLKGFPIPDAKKRFMSWLPPNFLPTEGKGIIFLDEMNGAMPAVQLPAYQLVLDFRLGDYVLPPGWTVLAAGNRAGDRAIVHTMSSALSSRFQHIDFEVSNDDWNVWAMHNNIHDDIRAFMRFRPALLHSFDPSQNPRCFPCPRTWKFVNDTYKKNLSPDDEFELIKGTVGEGAAGEFLGFTRLIKDLPSVDEVLLDPANARLPATPGAMFAITTALDRKTTKNNIGRATTYVERLPVEFQATFMRSIIRRDESLTETKSYMDWGIKNQDVLT